MSDTAAELRHLGLALEACGITPAQWHRDLRSRRFDSVRRRQRVWAMMWTTPMSPTREITMVGIAAVSGGFHHTTVMHGLRRAGVVEKPHDAKVREGWK